MKRKMTIPALFFLAAACLLLQPSGAFAHPTADLCLGCHYSYYGSPQEVCMTCHEGALHYRHIYQDPDDPQFPKCGSPPDKCKCCHGDPPDYENPPSVADKCAACHSVTASNIVARHNCSEHYGPDPYDLCPYPADDPAEVHCFCCHGLGGIPGSSIVPEEDANGNCNDVLDNDADCSTDNEDTGCTGAAMDEICDDGRDNDFDGLIDGEDPDCCGDGMVTPPEACDDGNTRDCDGCSETCEQESCGDGKQCLALGEECDDGNTASCDGCSNACELEYCGDGVVCPALGEECDGAVGCPSGYTCDQLCTCREEAASPCGASTTGTDTGNEGTALNVSLLIVPLFFLVLLRQGWARRREVCRGPIS